MGLFAHARPLVAAFAVAGFLAGLTACEGGGDGTALPSTLPSIERTFTREPTKTAEATTGPTDADKPSPTRTDDQESTTKPAEPTKAPTTATKETTKPPTTAANEPTTETAAPPPATTAATPTAGPTEVAATTTTSGISTLGWLLIILLIALGILVAVLLVNRSRRSAAWETEAVALAAAGRSLIATRLPPVLSAREAADRALSWPPVRADLTEASTRWGMLAGRATDDYHRDSAGQIGVMLQDLVSAIDAENQALATGRDWRQLSPQVDAIVRTLDAALMTFVAPQPDPGAGAQPYPA